MKFGSPSLGKASHDRVMLPNLCCMLGICFHSPPNSDMVYEIINVRTDINACNCTWGFMNTIKESAPKVDSSKKIPCHTGELNLRWWCAGRMLHQLITLMSSISWMKFVFRRLILLYQ